MYVDNSSTQKQRNKKNGEIDKTSTTNCKTKLVEYYFTTCGR